MVAFALIGYLGLSNGGYGIVERSEVGIAVWWTVLVGTLVGALPLAGGTLAGRAMLAVLALFAGWTALSLGWTESDERTAVELARVTTYLGVLALALGVQGEGRWRHLLHGVTAAAAGLCAIAVLSRLEPTWFPDRVTGTFLPGIEIESRLAYPLNYSSGLGALAALTLPLLLGATATARTLAVQSLAAAALPIAALALWLTTSSLSVPAAAIALTAFFVLAPDRLPKLATAAIAGVGSVILFAAVEQRDALGRGLPTPEALAEGDELKWIILVVCLGVGLIQGGIGLAARYGTRPAWMTFTREQTTIGGVVALGAVLVVALTAGLSGELSQRWDEFKGETATGASPAAESRADQIFSFSSSGRYEFWNSAIGASETDTLKGIGPGTFEFWYAREGRNPGFVRDAHSLYLETLAELGVVGLLLIGGFSIAVLLFAIARALRAPPEVRIGIATAAAACAAFIATAMVDWTWELGVLPVMFMCLVAIVVAGGREERRRPPRRGLAAYAVPAGAAVASGVAIAALAIPLAGNGAVRESQEAVRAERLDRALDAARDATSIQSYAASPYLQEALVQEELGNYEGALASARSATQEEPTNWRTWLVLSRIEAANGDAEGSLRAYREARSLNPRSAIFSR
jgi:hypothetical protein